MGMTPYYDFARGDCAVVYKCLLAHRDGISVTDMSRETGIDMGRVRGCVMRLSNSGKAEAIDKKGNGKRWRAI